MTDGPCSSSCPSSAASGRQSGQAGQHPASRRPAADRRRSATQTGTWRCSSRPPAGDGRSLALIVVHDDAEREYAYRVSPLGRLEAAWSKPAVGLDRRQHEKRLDSDLSHLASALGTSIAPPAGGLRGGVTKFSPHMAGRTTQRNPGCSHSGCRSGGAWRRRRRPVAPAVILGTGIGAAFEHAAWNGGRVPRIDALSFAAPWTARGRTAWGRRLMARGIPIARPLPRRCRSCPPPHSHWEENCRPGSTFVSVKFQILPWTSPPPSCGWPASSPRGQLLPLGVGRPSPAARNPPSASVRMLSGPEPRKPSHPPRRHAPPGAVRP